MRAALNLNDVLLPGWLVGFGVGGGGARVRVGSASLSEPHMSVKRSWFIRTTLLETIFGLKSVQHA